MLPSSATFEVVGKLGAGGMADVFLAKASFPGGSRTVALKRIRLTLQEQPEVWAQFKREARVLEHLDHKAIVGLEAVGEDLLGPYLALEYVDGATAARLCQRTVRDGGTTPLRAVLTLVRDAAEGIAYAHQLKHAKGTGVLHRDIAPDNLLVGRDGVCKVNDFGIARMEGQTRVTHTGTVRGKLNYLAPELVHGEPHSVATDTFAFAATVFRLLTGLHAFRGANDAEVLRNLMFSPPAPLSAVRGDVPARVSEWVQAAVGSDPKARPTLSQLLELMPAPTGDDRLALAAWVNQVVPAGQPVGWLNDGARPVVVEPMTPLTDPRHASAPPIVIGVAIAKPDDRTSPPDKHETPTVRPGSAFRPTELADEPANRQEEPTLVPIGDHATSEMPRPALGDSTVPPTDRVAAMADLSGRATLRMAPVPARPMLIRDAEGRVLGPVPELTTETDRQPATVSERGLLREQHPVATVPAELTEIVSLVAQAPTVRGKVVFGSEGRSRRGRGAVVAGVLVALLTLAFGIWFAIWRLVAR